MIRRMILDSYAWFVDLVAERRPLDRDQVLALADGSIFTGRQALERKLVDALGGEAEAKAWLKTKDVDDGLEVIEWKPRRESSGFLLARAGAVLLRLAGLSDVADLLTAGSVTDRVFLDGLVSVWHPAQGAGNRP